MIAALASVRPAWAMTITPSSPIANTTFTISGDLDGAGSSLTVRTGSICNQGTIVFGPKAVGPGVYSVDVVGGLPAGQYVARTFIEGCHIFTVIPATILIEVVVEVPFSICVIQLGVQESDGTIAWLPGYAYPDTPISLCQNMTEVLGQDVLDRTIVLHQFIQNRTYYEIVTVAVPVSS
jgi:hypothetical protein